MAVFEKVVNKVRGFFGRDPRRGAPRKTPRVIPASEHGIRPELVSWQSVKACQALQKNGYKAYVVGGAVRDMLLGVKPKDFDIATDATPEEVKKCERRAYIIGRRFKIVHVMFGAEVVECATFRSIDGRGTRKDAAGRVILDNHYGEMWEDAARRDFTINALYYDPSTGDILDYHDGYRDVKDRVLRMIGDPAERYREDPVRMMRAVRIAAKLGFRIDEGTRAPIAKMAPLLGNVPDARLFDEVMKMLTSGHAVACVEAFRKEGLHHGLLPVLDIMDTASEGERFMMQALRRTDERLAAGKKTSPSFLFATLLWPQTLRRWKHFEGKGESRAQALFDACDMVLRTQCEKLVIQRRHQEEIQAIWTLQYRFEKRTGKTPYSVLKHTKRRAGYDFMILRCANGEVPLSFVRWWKDFFEEGEERKKELIAEAETAARRRRRGAAEEPLRLPTEEEIRALELKPEPGAAPAAGIADPGESEEAAGERAGGRPRRRRRRSRQAKAPGGVQGFFVPPESDRKTSAAKPRTRRPMAARNGDIREA